MKSRLLLVAVALAVGGGQRAAADELVTRDNKVHRGYVFQGGGEEMRLNEFGCSVPAMTLGIRRFRKRDVLEVRYDADSSGFFRQLDTLRPDDAAGRLALMRWALGRRLKNEAQRAAAELLLLDPKNEEALKVLRGEAKWQQLRKGHLHLDRQLTSGLRSIIRLDSGEARRTASERLARDTGAAVPAHLVERMARSLHQDRGVTNKVPITRRNADFPGGTYSLFVPLAYDPLEPLPLLVALHGGGIMQAEDKVVGSGRDAVARFQAGAEASGMILVAPTAVEAPWKTTVNADWIQNVIAEVASLWSVDLNRVHVVGHSGGGDGAWFFGSRYAEQLASVGVAAAGAPSGHGTIVGKGTGLWMYHSDDDDVVPLAPVEKVARRLLKSKEDFVFCLLPKEGHGFPPAAAADLFRYIKPRRRAKAASAWPQWSFARAPDKHEIEAFGDPAGGWGATLPSNPSFEDLLAIVRAGRVDAEPAARVLASGFRGPSEDRASVHALVMERKHPVFARAWAAWLLGRWQDPEAVNVLGDVLRSESDAFLLKQAALSVARLGSADNIEDVRWALSDNARRFKGLRGQTVTYVDYERTCNLGAALAEAMGRIAKGKAKEVQADLEQTLVIDILRDRRRVLHRRENGENPGRLKAALAEALARTYRSIDAERTLFDMLAAVVKRDPLARQAVQRGRAEGWK